MKRLLIVLNFIAHTASGFEHEGILNEFSFALSAPADMSGFSLFMQDPEDSPAKVARIKKYLLMGVRGVALPFDEDPQDIPDREVGGYMSLESAAEIIGAADLLSSIEKAKVSLVSIQSPVVPSIIKSNYEVQEDELPENSFEVSKAPRQKRKYMKQEPDKEQNPVRWEQWRRDRDANNRAVRRCRDDKK